MNKYILIVLMAGFVFPVSADNLFIELTQGENITQKELEEARKQLEDHKDVELSNKLSVNPFHHRNQNVETLKQAFCNNCHLANPHQANQRNRSFLNMHSNYISCETCHLKTENINMDYRWLAFDYPDAGKIIDVSSSVHTQAEEVKTSIIPRPAARIVPVYQGDPVLIFKDDAFSSEVSKKWKTLAVEDKARLKAELHAPLNKKGYECKKCHSEKQELLDLKILGANQKQSHSITSNKIAHFFNRYKNDTDTLKMSDLLR